MSTCPEIPIFPEDPFIYYAKMLIRTFREQYGSDKPTVNGYNVFEDSASPSGTTDGGSNEARSWNSYKTNGASELDAVDVQIGTVAQKNNGSPFNLTGFPNPPNITSWDTALRFYIKGPQWGAFSDYQTAPWEARNTQETGWLDIAGGLIVHPMLRLDDTRLEFDNSVGIEDLWQAWQQTLSGKELRSDLPITTTTTTTIPGSSVTVTSTERKDMLKFGFLLEVLDAFIHIHETGSTALQVNMEPFTWCQMFWYGYDVNDIGLNNQIEQLSNTTNGNVWEGTLNPPSSVSNSRIIYHPVEGDQSLQISGPPRRAAGAIYDPDHRWGYMGHSVEIRDADYGAFIFWLTEALKLLRNMEWSKFNIDFYEYLSDTFFDANIERGLAAAECDITGEPYGGLTGVDPYANRCSIEVFRSMADYLFFSNPNEIPSAQNLLGPANLIDRLSLPSSIVSFWKEFLEEHSVSISIDTEALNYAILNQGIEGECDAVSLVVPTNPDLKFQPIDAFDCRPEDLDELVVENYATCIPDPNAVVPNWLNQTEEEPFLNQKTCQYSIVVLADPPDCNQEYLDTFVPYAVDKLLDYYNKEPNTEFIDLGTGQVSMQGSREALMRGSLGKFRDGTTFIGSARVSNFYIPPRPLAKTKILITVSAEEFNRIPEKEATIQSGQPDTAYADGEPSYVVFAASEIVDIFEKVSFSFSIYDKFYADWHLETGKIIKNLDFSADSERLDNFLKETDLLLKESGYLISDLKWIEIGFGPTFEIEYVKAQRPNSVPVVLSKGFKAYKSKLVNKTIAAYVSQLPNIKDDLMSRQTLSWLDILTKYRYPALEESYVLDPSSPVGDGNQGLKVIQDLSCAAGSSSGIFEPSLFGSSIQRQKWAESQINDIKGALVSQLTANPCALVDGRILEHQGRVDFAMQITDLTLKEYLSSDRFINDLPELLVRGRFKDIKSLYDGMLNNLSMCGMIDLIKAAVDCSLNALGFDDSITIITGAAVKGLGDELVQKFVRELPPEAQSVIIAAIRESFPQLLPFLAGFVKVRVEGENGEVIDPIYENVTSYTSNEVPLGALGDQTFIDVVTSPGSKTTEASLSVPPGDIGSLGQENRYATPQDYGNLKNVIADLVTNEILNVDEVLNVLNNLPGAGIAVNIIEKIDKFCVAPPNFYPPLKEYIKLPGVQIDFCELQAGITIPTFPKPQFNSFSKVLIDNALRVLQELVIRLIILVLKKVLEIIAEELCKTRVGSDPLNLRDAIKSSICGDISGDIDPNIIDSALSEAMGVAACVDDPAAMGRLIDNIASVITQCELLDLINGEGSDNLYDLVVEIVKNDPATAPLSECLYDKISVHKFFKSMGVFIDQEQLCVQNPINLPVSREVCDNLGLLNVFRSVRADALRDKGVDEECIEGQLCKLRDQTLDDLGDLVGLLQAGVFSNIIPDILNDVNSDKPSLLPSEMPLVTAAFDDLYTNIFDSMAISFTEDIIGRRGFLNMVLADSRGRGYMEHLKFQNSALGPSIFNIYGSRGTRTQPPWDEWGVGVNTKNNWNAWVGTDERQFTDNTLFWHLPFLFNPLSSTGGASEPLTDASNQGSVGSESTTGRPPAVGGLPDKIAGHLQDILVNLSLDYDIDRDYTTDIIYNDYDRPDALQFVLSYKYWTEPPTIEDTNSWDGHAVRIVMFSEKWEGSGSPNSEIIANINVESSLGEPEAAYKENSLSQYYKNGSSSPYSTFQSLIQDKVYTQIGIYNSFLNQYDNTIEPLLEPLYEKLSERYLEFLASALADESPCFEYGFDPTQQPIVRYFHDTEFNGDIPAAVARYGGSEGNPPFYIEPPSFTGYMQIAQRIIPKFKPCDNSEDVVSFPEFNSLSLACSSFTSKINEDPRAGLKVRGVSEAYERPFDRHLSRGSLGIIEGTIIATIRTYLVEQMMKAMPVLAFMQLDEINYGEMFADFIVDSMEKGMKDSGRGRRYVDKFEDYWWLFLEQVVQNYGIKVNNGIITDQTPEEAEAIEFINQYIDDNWTFISAGSVTGTSQARKIAKRRKEEWDKVFESTVVTNPSSGNIFSIESPVIDKCKVILKRYIIEEYSRTKDIFANYVDPLYKDINNIILKRPEIVRGAISAFEEGPLDVPDNNYYFSNISSTTTAAQHPHDVTLTPLLENSNTPFVLERYIIAKSDTPTANSIKQFGNIANIFDADTGVGGLEILSGDDVYFGLRLVFFPEAVGLKAEFESAMADIEDVDGFAYKAFSKLYKNAIPLANAELRFTTESYTPELYNEYVQALVCELIEKPEYKLLFEHCFPMNKYMDILALFVANTFVPSLARVEDGWAAKTLSAAAARGERGGGRWIGIGKMGGMNTWRGNEGMKNSFHNTKRMARQTLEAACYTSYDYRDKRDYMSAQEVYVDNMTPAHDTDPGIKWWQWSSLRPPPCDKED